jgi:hypothetical protein
MQFHKHINSNIGMANQALGWLARQEKLIIIKAKDDKYICLTETERRQYRPEA